MKFKIEKVTKDEYPDFYWAELQSQVTGHFTKNFYQLFESKINLKDNPVKYFKGDGQKGSVYFFAFVDDLLVGQLSLKQSPFTENMLWFTSISVDPKFQRQCIARKLIDEGFQFAGENSKEVLMSYYEDEVKDFLPYLIKMKAFKHKILIHERNDNYQYFSYGVNKEGKKVKGEFFKGEVKV